jgi:hypothetical protein
MSSRATRRSSGAIPDRLFPTADRNGDLPQKSADPPSAEKAPGHGAKSDAVRERAIVALLSANTLAAAAQQCHLNEKTLRRWMANDEAFKHELAVRRRAIFEMAMNRLQLLTAQAVGTLAALMGRGTPPNVRLGAARAVAELGIGRNDAESIMRKLDEIEAFQRQQGTKER